MRSLTRVLAASSLTFALLVVAACSDPAYLLLTIEDPDNVAADFQTIAVGASLENLISTEPDSDTFPLTVTAVRDEAGPMTLWAEARDANGHVLGRGYTQATFSTQGTSTAVVFLAQACASDANCDDGVFCNGTETCNNGSCIDGAEPCPPSPIGCVDVACVEPSDTCAITPIHERCEPLVGPNGPEATYCDMRIGCVPGDPCNVEGASCPRLQPCDAVRTCLSGRCIPQEPVAVDDSNPCTIDYCDNEAGVVHVADPRVDGNTCELTTTDLGICYDGACVVSVCGDGFVDNDRSEVCDDGPANSDTNANACRTDCTAFRCGDGVQDYNEECDDANSDEQDECRNGCVQNDCGDSVLNIGIENCDDGNSDNTDACVVGCVAASCGDGFVHAGTEACDDGNASDDDPCLTDCTPNTCGDGHLNPQSEECDDGNGSNTDGCVAGCLRATCGDGHVQAGTEQCDDANSVATDGCLPGCISNICGDGVINTGVEACDDGNTVSFDGCSAQCSYIIFQTALDGPVSRAAPVTTIDTAPVPLIFVPTTDGILHAVHATTGAEVWTYDAGATLRATPLVLADGIFLLSDDATVHYVPTAGPPATWTYALETTSSAIGLSIDEDFDPQPEGALVVDDVGTIYRLGTTGVRKDIGLGGTYPYSTHAMGTCDGCATTTLNHNNPPHALLLPLDNKIWLLDFETPCAPRSLNLAAGERVLGHAVFLGNNNISGDSGDKVYAATSFNRIIQASGSGFDIDCGSVTVGIDWSYASGTTLAAEPVVTTSATAVYSGGANGVLFSLATSPAPTTPEWTYNAGAAIQTSPALDGGGNLYVGDAAGYVHAVRAGDGQFVWKLLLDGPTAGSPLVRDYAVYVATAPGTLYALERGGPAPWAHNIWSRQGANNQGVSRSSACASVNATPFDLLLVACLSAWFATRLWRRRRLTQMVALRVHDTARRD